MKPMRKIHGLKGTPEYTVWCNMKARCMNKANPRYIHYGGRGIKVCDRWMHSAANFVEDMGLRPTPEHSIDRIDVNGNYEPSNCRWATRTTQSQNIRTYAKSLSGQKGVVWSKLEKRWKVQISYTKHINLGTYENLEDAIKARQDAESKYWNEESEL